MNKLELWLIYCQKNPQFLLEEETVTLTVKGLRKLYNQAFDAGHELGFENGKAWEKSQIPKKEKDFADIFADIFGGSK